MSATKEVRHINLVGPFEKEGEFCFLAPISVLGDGLGRGMSVSDLALYENGIPLGPGRQNHEAIRVRGLGKYSHWEDSVYFSTSDNSDPRTNGRHYHVTVTERDHRADAVCYGISVANKYLGMMKDIDRNSYQPLKGKVIFELGAGEKLLATLALIAMGATVYVKEREDIVWAPDVHGAFAREMFFQFKEISNDYDFDALQHLADTGIINQNRLVLLNEDWEVVAEKLSDKIDCTLSMAVLEHVDDLTEILSFLHKITAQNGAGVHCVDFRDHGGFDRPLEFLLFSEEELVKASAYRYSRGSGVRSCELHSIAEKAGFGVEAKATREVDPVYLDDFMIRLENSTSKYKKYSKEELRPDGVTFLLEKNG